MFCFFNVCEWLIFYFVYFCCCCIIDTSKLNANDFNFKLQYKKKSFKNNLNQKQYTRVYRQTLEAHSLLKGGFLKSNSNLNKHRKKVIVYRFKLYSITEKCNIILFYKNIYIYLILLFFETLKRIPFCVHLTLVWNLFMFVFFII